jgi:hypothetical protein
MELRFHPLARAEYVEAIVYLEQRRSGWLGWLGSMEMKRSSTPSRISSGGQATGAVAHDRGCLSFEDVSAAPSTGAQTGRERPNSPDCRTNTKPPNPSEFEG